jgi:hypothetical protein
MFARVKKSGKNHYLQIVENRKIKGKVVQRVIATIGRMDELQTKEPDRNASAIPFTVFRKRSSDSLR